MPAWRPPRSRTGQSRHPPIQELFSRLARASALSQPKPSVGSLASLSFYPLARASSRYSPMCKTALALRFNGRKRHAICSRRGGRLVQRTAGRRRSRRDSRLIVKTSPRFTVNWPALASSILEDSGTRFYKSEVRSDLASAERAGSAGKHCSSRARGDKNSPAECEPRPGHASLCDIIRRHGLYRITSELVKAVEYRAQLG